MRRNQTDLLCKVQEEQESECNVGRLLGVCRIENIQNKGLSKPQTLAGINHRMNGKIGWLTDVVTSTAT